MDVSFQCDSTEIEKALNQGIISVNEVRRLYGFPKNPEVVHPVWVRSCPNCGAPVKGRVCEYCDSVFSSIPVEPIKSLQLRIDEWKFSKDIDDLYNATIHAMCRRF